MKKDEGSEQGVNQPWWWQWTYADIPWAKKGLISSEREKREKIYSFQLKPRLGLCVGFPRSADGACGTW